MSRHWIPFSGLALTLIVASCAGPGRSHGTPATTPQPSSNKPLPVNNRGGVSAISLGDFFALQQSGKALIYDARAPFFYHLGHVPGAANLSHKQCASAITARKSEIKTALAAGKTIIVYCSNRSCPDARTVAIHLSNCGYPARIFPGGWEEWRAAGLSD